MQFDREHLRTCMFYDFKSGLKAVESYRRLCQAFGPNVVSERTTRDWFKRFKEGDADFQDKPRSGRPSTFDDERLLQLLNADPRRTTRELAEDFGCHHSTIHDHLHALGKIVKQGMWVPHDLTDNDRKRRIDTCTTLLSYRRTTGWLDSIITGDEKWVLYVNIARRHSWVSSGEPAATQPKIERHQRKVMLSVWWDVQGVVMFELLPRNVNVTAAFYCEQLQRLSAEIHRMRPQLGQVRFLHDNARPHTALITRDTLLKLGWEVLPHPPYSPDLAPSDYHLFRSLQHFLKGKVYENDDMIENDMRAFFEGHPPSFYADGIRQLPNRWRKVIDSNGDYVVD